MERDRSLSICSLVYEIKRVDERTFSLTIKGDKDRLDELCIQPVKLDDKDFHLIVGTIPVKSVQFYYYGKKVSRLKGTKVPRGK